MRSVVSVWTSWGDYVLSVRDVRRGESLSVGSPPRRLVSLQQGAPRVWQAQQERVLGADETLTVRCGELTYTVCSAEAESAPDFAPARRGFALGDVLVMGVLVAALFWHPTKAEAEASVAPTTPTPTAQRSAIESDELAPAERAIFAIVAQPEREPVSLPGAMRCGRFEPGHPNTDREARGRYGVAGPSDNVDPHLSRPVPGDGYPTATGSPGWGHPRTQLGSNAPTADFGRESALGPDPSNARGEIWGDELHDKWGEAELGSVSRAGGTLKTLDVQPLAAHLDSGLRVIHTGLRVSGSRKASEVGRAMAAHFDEFRACAAATTPKTELRIRLDFEVTQDGRVSGIAPHAGAAQPCLARSLSRITFAPGASEVTHVVYPLYFLPFETAL